MRENTHTHTHTNKNKTGRVSDGRSVTDVAQFLSLIYPH